jgi:hypothetical protein
VLLRRSGTSHQSCLAAVLIDWNEAAALEFLGPPGLNLQYQATIQQILNNLGTMDGHWVEVPLDWSINVRCDDWLNDCELGDSAYTTMTGPMGIATINFCPSFFKEPHLFNQVSRGQSALAGYWWRNNMENYAKSKGEALH